jgi:transposase
MPNSKKIIADKGYIGIEKLHVNSAIPKKSSKNHPLSKEERAKNRQLSKDRMLIENVFCTLKRFRILSGCYRNRRRRLELRFNLIAAIYNMEL